MTYQALLPTKWHLTPTVTLTGIFAVYRDPIVVVAVLIGFGDVSDHIGRRTTMLLGLGASLIGTFLFRRRAQRTVAVRRSRLHGRRRRLDRRAFDGGDGGVQRRGTGEAGRIRHRRRSGLRFRRGSAPRRRADAICAVADPSQLLGPVRPDRPAVHRDLVPASSVSEAKRPAAGVRRFLPCRPALRPAFTLASIAVTTAYTHGVLILSLGGQVARDLVGSSNALVNGAALSLFAITSGVVGIAARTFGRGRQ